MTYWDTAFIQDEIFDTKLRYIFIPNSITNCTNTIYKNTETAATPKACTNEFVVLPTYAKL
jgi:hypothetical protein